jgi:hypothetical protein
MRPHYPKIEKSRQPFWDRKIRRGRLVFSVAAPTGPSRRQAFDGVLSFAAGRRQSLPNVARSVFIIGAETPRSGKGQKSPARQNDRRAGATTIRATARLEYGRRGNGVLRSKVWGAGRNRGAEFFKTAASKRSYKPSMLEVIQAEHVGGHTS